MMRRCALLVLAMVARHGFALEPNRSLSQYGHNAWRIQDGFLPGPPQQIGLAQTGDGYLWISTRSGLFRFDGVRLTPWRAPDGKEDRMYAPIAAKDGSLWIGRDTVLTHILTDGRVVNFDVPRVIHEIEDSEGVLWALSSHNSEGDKSMPHQGFGRPMFGASGRIAADGRSGLHSARSGWKLVD